MNEDNKKTLEDFDEAFINCCARTGISYEDTQKALLESPQRKVLVEAIVTIESTSPKVLIN